MSFQATSAQAVSTPNWAPAGAGANAIAMDSANNLYVTNYNAGSISKIGQNASSATFTSGLTLPQAIAIDSSGNVYTASNGTNIVIKTTPGGVSSQLGGSTGTNPRGIALDSSGNVYTANWVGNSVTKITSDGSTTTTLASTGANTGPVDLVVDSSGNIFTANNTSNTISKITPGGAVTTFATIAGSSPNGIAIDGSNNLYVSGQTSGRAYKVSSSGTVTNLGDTGTSPQGITVDSHGNVYTANSSSNNVTRITAAGVVSTVGTTGSMPLDLVVDSSNGNIFTANTSGNNVSKITQGAEVTSISPNNGPTTGNTTITLNGYWMTGVDGVSVGGETCTDLNVVSDAQVTCKTPAAYYGGATDVVLTRAGDTTTVENGFTYNPSTPTVTLVTPNNGTTMGGTPVVITGTGFWDGAQVYIDGNYCNDPVFNSATELTCVTPEANDLQAGPVEVSVENPDSGTGSLSDGFTYTQSTPTVDDVSPAYLNSADGGQITITGTNFIDDPEPEVLVGGEPCAIVSVNATTIVCDAPDGSAGAKDVTVTNADGGTVTQDNEITFVSSPTIASINPVSGNNTGNTVITITGTNFINGATVTVGGVECQGISFDSPTQLRCWTPNLGTNGTQDVEVINPDAASGYGTATLPNAFTTVTPPTIDSVAPANIAASGGNRQITITGTDFVGPAIVGIGGRGPCSNVVVVNSTTITCDVPDGPTGSGLVSVYNGDGGRGELSAALTYISVPTATGLSPTVGNNTGGTAITINGGGLMSGSTVTVGGQACTNVVVDVPGGTITCDVPDLSPATGNQAVVVTNPDAPDPNPDGLGQVTVPGGFTVVTPPTFTGTSPASVSAAGDTDIIISGGGFVDGATVTVGGLACIPATVSNGGNTLTCPAPAGSPGSKAIEVTNPDGGTVSAGNITYISAPTATELSETSGPSAGNTEITITGTGFVSDATVTIGGVACVVSAVTATSVTCTTGAGMPLGEQDLVVTNGDGGATAPLTFDVISSPTITGVSPTDVSVAGGTEITISGTQFVASPAPTVTVGGEPCTSFTVVSSTVITCVLPEGTAGAKEIVVTNDDGGTATAPSDINYISNPEATSISPTRGNNTGGTEITIAGTGFVDGATVTVGGQACTPVTFVSDTEIKCTTPNLGTNGDQDVVVSNPDAAGGLGASTLDDAFTTVTPPEIDSLDTDEGLSQGGTQITITGDNFVDGDDFEVLIGGQPCNPVAVVSPTQITCTTPAGNPGPQDIVINNGDGGTVTLDDGFTYISMPTIGSVSPTSGVEGDTITITGTQFVASPLPSVTVGGQPCTNITVVSPTEITCDAPANPDGPVDVVVTNDDGGTVTDQGGFTYVTPPTVSGISPDKGSTSGGTEITIDGTGFKNGVEVTVGGEPCAPVTFVSSSQIKCTVPASDEGATGDRDVVITNPDGGHVTEADGFEYEPSNPQISGISPSSGNNTGGTKITIDGSDFGPGTTVEVGGQPCTNLVRVSLTKITCTTPAGSDGPAEVKVINQDGSEASDAGGFTFVTPPAVSKVSPNSGSSKGGDEIAITGGPFAGNVVVKIGGKECKPVTIVSESEIKCKTPTGVAGKADLEVFNGDGGITTVKNAFTFVSPNTNTVKPFKPAKTKVKGKPNAKKWRVSWSLPKGTNAKRPVTGFKLTVQLRGKKKVIILRNLKKTARGYTLTRKALNKAVKKAFHLSLSTRGEVGNFYVFTVRVYAKNAAGYGKPSTSRLVMKK